jgi:hypothetical protein
MSCGAIARIVGHQPPRVGAARHFEGQLARCGARQQRLHQRRQRNVGVHVPAQPHFAIAGDDAAAQVDLLLRHREVGVRQDHAEQEQAVRVLHQLRHLRQPGHTHVGAHQRRIRIGQQAAAHEAGGHGQRQAPRQLGHLGLQAVAAHLHVHHQHRALGLLQALQHLVGAGGQRIRVHRGRLDGRHRCAG